MSDLYCNSIAIQNQSLYKTENINEKSDGKSDKRSSLTNATNNKNIHS